MKGKLPLKAPVGAPIGTPTKRHSVMISSELHHRIRVSAALEGKQIGDLVEGFLRECLDKK